MTQTQTQSCWDPVKELMDGAAPVQYGPMHAYHATHSPRRMLYTMSYYKFAAKMIANNLGERRGRVLDIGCGEGLGTWLLAKECGSAHGLDIDADLIDVARENWQAPGSDVSVTQNTQSSASFDCSDFLQAKPDPDQLYDGVASMDVIEHILPDNADHFIANIAAHLTEAGVAVVGTPNITSRQYASAVTNAGHVNMYSGESLQAAFEKHFHHVFVFAANDEVIHTGFFPMAHYLIALACGRK